MFPKIIKIGGLDYSVDYTKERVEGSDKGADYAGIVNHPDCTIKIKRGNHKDYTNCIMLHEILHALSSQLNLNLGTQENEETVIDSLSYGLYQVLKDNKLDFYRGKSGTTKTNAMPKGVISLLKEIEFVEDSSSREYCPCCTSPREYGHRKKCKLAAILNKKGVK